MLLEGRFEMPNSQHHPDSDKSPGSEPTEQSCEEGVENLHQDVAERREVLAELAAYDKEIGI